MANYNPPDAHHVNFNFKDIVTGSTDLNFGVDEQNLASLEATIDTSFLAFFRRRVLILMHWKLSLMFHSTQSFMPY